MLPDKKVLKRCDFFCRYHNIGLFLLPNIEIVISPQKSSIRLYFILYELMFALKTPIRILFIHDSAGASSSKSLLPL